MILIEKLKMMGIIPSVLLCFYLMIILSFLIFPSESSCSGFSINLIHRDSQFSPFYNSSNTRYEILRNSLHRAKTPLRPEGGEYLVEISVGTPPLHFLVAVDTSSDLTWVQCKPCVECYKQNSPLFDPEKSSTYKKQPCLSKACQSMQPHSCDEKKFCKYELFNGDISFSRGDLASESFALKSTSGEPVIFPKFSFGCGHLNHGRLNDLTDGIVGLGNGDLSIVNQLSETINGKFSYCMVFLELTNVSSKLSFGSDAVVSGFGVQTTPLFTKDTDTFYYLNLESVSIGDTNLKFETKKYTNNTNIDEGNIIIDSGSIATYLPGEFYQKIEDEIKRIIPLTPVEREEVLRLCYKNEEGVAQKVPNITFHFTGADWELGALNTILRMEDGKSCFSMAPAGDIAIFGNLQQMNYLVGYDLNNRALSIKKTDCTNY